MFKINQHVVVRKSGQHYYGRIKKIVTEESGTVYFVVFGPDEKWQEFKAADMEPIHVTINPPMMGESL